MVEFHRAIECFIGHIVHYIRFRNATDVLYGVNRRLFGMLLLCAGVGLKKKSPIDNVNAC